MDEIAQTASLAHKKIMISLATFHLLLPVVAFLTGYFWLFFTLAFVGALISIGWIGWHAKQQKCEGLVRQHWQTAWQRCRWLLLAYLISALIMLIGYLVSLSQTDHQLEEFMWIAFSRVAIVPTLLTALAIFVLESFSLIQAKKGY